MTITTWPIDAVAAVPGRQLREAHSVYMAGASAADPFGVRSGVRPGTSPTTVTATSTTWTVGAHAGVVDLQPAVEASGYAYAVNATGGLPSGAVTAADLTRPRVDIVWVRNDDPSEGDASPNPTVVFGYTAGVPLAVPVAPATPARCMVLATIQVPMSGGGSPTVIWVAPYTVAAGAPTPVWSAADRDAKFPVPYDGLCVYRLDLHLTETYNGALATWTGAPQAFTPVLSAAGTNCSGYTATGRYIQTGKNITFWFQINMAAITSIAGMWEITLPVTANATLRPSAGVARGYKSTGGLMAVLLPGVNSASKLLLQYSATFNGAFNVVAYNAPWVWATGDIIDGYITYEAA